MTRQLFVMAHDMARRNALEAVRTAPEGHVVEIRQAKRTDAQNRLLWPLLNHLADALPWHGQALTAEEYKDLLTAALRREKVVPGIGGGVVVLGQRTSKMTKAEFNDLIEFIYSFAAERGIEFPAAPVDESYWEVPF